MNGDKVSCLFKVTDVKSAPSTFYDLAHTRPRRVTVQHCVALAQMDVGADGKIGFQKRRAPCETEFEDTFVFSQCGRSL